MSELERRTGVHREVIRVMLRKGLLPEPRRPARNLAEYDDSHVRGIAAVRELQQTSRMTLEEIKDALDQFGLEKRAGGSAGVHLDQLIADRFGLDEAPPVELSVLVSRAPEARTDALAFQSLGMLSIQVVDGRETLSLDDARLVDIWGRIRATGFVEELGFSPERIGFYLEAARFIARKEVETFFAESSAPIPPERAAQMLHIALPLMLDFLGLLRLKAFINTLSDHIKTQSLK